MFIDILEMQTFANDKWFDSKTMSSLPEIDKTKI